LQTIQTKGLQATESGQKLPFVWTRTLAEILHKIWDLSSFYVASTSHTKY